jgi:hypothetical protein
MKAISELRKFTLSANRGEQFQSKTEHELPRAVIFRIQWKQAPQLGPHRGQNGTNPGLMKDRALESLCQAATHHDNT